MIPAENRERYSWFDSSWLTQARRATTGSPVVKLALHRATQGEPDFITNNVIPVQDGRWWFMQHEGEGEFTGGSILMPNRTIPVGPDGGTPVVEMPDAYRALRAFEHISASYHATAKDMAYVENSLGRDVVLSQLINRDDVALREAYEERLRHYLDIAKRRLKRRLRETSSTRDQRLLDRLERAGSLTDSLGRFNRCALPLVIRLVQRLASTKVQQQELKRLYNQREQHGFAQSVAQLEALTEWASTQTVQMARAPWLKPSRWNKASAAERRTFMKRIGYAYHTAIPEIRKRLRQWSVPEPFNNRFRQADALLASALEHMKSFLDATDGTPWYSNMLESMEEQLTLAAQQLAMPLISAVLHDLVMTLSVEVRQQQRAGEQPVVVSDSAMNEFRSAAILAVRTLEDLKRVYASKLPGTKFSAQIDMLCAQILRDAQRDSGYHVGFVVYQRMRAHEALTNGARIAA